MVTPVFSNRTSGDSWLGSRLSVGVTAREPVGNGAAGPIAGNVGAREPPFRDGAVWLRMRKWLCLQKSM